MLKIGDSTFKNTYGESNTILSGQMTKALVHLKNTKVIGSIANLGLSFGCFSLQSESKLTLEDSHFENNAVLDGSSLLKIGNDVVLTIDRTTFHNNAAKRGTHGIKVIPDGDIAATVV